MSGAWITAGGLVALGGIIWALTYAVKRMVRAQAQAQRDREAVENVEERRKVEEKVDRKGIGWMRAELRRRWMSKPGE